MSLPHRADHDPIVEYPHCQTCHAALRAAFIAVADMDPADRDLDKLIGVLRRAAAGNLRRVS